jgi:hypothetical protein
VRRASSGRRGLGFTMRARVAAGEARVKGSAGFVGDDAQSYNASISQRRARWS